jgi:hypothetical protein
MTMQKWLGWVVVGVSSVEFTSMVRVEESVVLSMGSASDVDDSCSIVVLFGVEGEGAVTANHLYCSVGF